MKRILFLGSLGPPFGGIASHLSDMKKLYDSRGEKFFIYTLLTRRKWYAIPIDLLRIWRILVREKIDLVSAYHAYPEGYVASLIKRLWGIPYALTIFGELHVENRREFKPAIDNASLVMASSEYCASGVKKFSNNLVTVTPYGIDLDHFKRTQRYIPQSGLLFVGNVDKRFGLLKLLAALVILKAKGLNVQLEVIGEGDQIPTLREEIRRWGLMAAIREGVDYDAVAWYYNNSAILVNPANTKLACMGLSMKEAMACELPVIASNIGGIAEAVENMTTGLLFEPDNAQDLAGKIATLWNDPTIARTMGRAGRRKAERLFDKNKTSERILRLLNDL